MTKISNELRIRNLWYSNGKMKCLDCDEIIEKGLEYFNVFQDSFKIREAHSNDRSCKRKNND